MFAAVVTIYSWVGDSSPSEHLDQMLRLPGVDWQPRI